jgi:hypothetical protein
VQRDLLPIGRADWFKSNVGANCRFKPLSIGRIARPEGQLQNVRSDTQIAGHRRTPVPGNDHSVFILDDGMPWQIPKLAHALPKLFVAVRFGGADVMPEDPSVGVERIAEYRLADQRFAVEFHGVGVDTLGQPAGALVLVVLDGVALEADPLHRVQDQPPFDVRVFEPPDRLLQVGADLVSEVGKVVRPGQDVVLDEGVERDPLMAGDLQRLGDVTGCVVAQVVKSISHHVPSSRLA